MSKTTIKEKPPFMQGGKQNDYVQWLKDCLEEQQATNIKLREDIGVLRILASQVSQESLGLTGDETVDELRAKLAQSQAEVRELTARLEESDRRWDWVRRLFSVNNQILSPAMKLVMWWVFFRVLQDRPAGPTDLEGATRIQIEGQDSVATGVGMSGDTCGKMIKKLHGVGLVERIEEKLPATKDAPPQTHVHAALTLLSWEPDELALAPGSKGRNHGGGGRQKCKFKDCGSERLVRRTEIICLDCRRRQGDLIETPLNPPDEDEDLFVSGSLAEAAETVLELERQKELARTCAEDEETAGDLEDDGVDKETNATPQIAVRVQSASQASSRVLSVLDRRTPGERAAEAAGVPEPAGPCASGHTGGYYWSFQYRGWFCKKCHSGPKEVSGHGRED